MEICVHTNVNNNSFATGIHRMRVRMNEYDHSIEVGIHGMRVHQHTETTIT